MSGAERTIYTERLRMEAVAKRHRISRYAHALKLFGQSWASYDERIEDAMRYARESLEAESTMHTCPDCGQACYCADGDLDDCEVTTWQWAALNCVHECDDGYDEDGP